MVRKPQYDLIKIDKARFDDAIKAYFLWRDLNAVIKNSYNRAVNIPETITEALLCYALKFDLNKGTAGDVKDPQTSEIIELKATSNWESDLTSFSPNENFDKLYFARLNQKDDEIFFYDTELDSTMLKGIEVNRTQTVGDQQIQKRRPRFSVIDKIINAKNIKPVARIDLRKGKVK